MKVQIQKTIAKANEAWAKRPARKYAGNKPRMRQKKSIYLLFQKASVEELGSILGV